MGKFSLRSIEAKVVRVSEADSKGNFLRAQKVVCDEIHKELEESNTAHREQILSHLTHARPEISK